MERANNIYSGTLSNQRTEREIAHGKLARKLAAEGIVLLKNDGLLPLKAAEPVALFGGGAGHTITRGIGSGDVNNRESITIYQGLKAVCASVTSKSWFLDYQERYIKARALWKEKILKDAEGMDNPFDAYAKNPFSLPDGRNITKEDIKGASVAVYVISRIAGEGKDRRLAEGDYYLSIREREDILYLCQENIPVVLIINSGAPVEIAGILQEAANIKAVLYISLPGQEGGNAVADMLYGKVVPGGRLTSTWAASYKDYPCAASYGYLNGNLEKEEYREGIYVGYRYFTSFNIKPLFPFGYGLSYTSFEIKFEDIKITGTNINVCVSVKNTGDCYSGREVVQVYITPPQTGIYKEYQKLAGFAKTGVLKPGDMQKLSITIRQKQLASFSEEIDSWITENGKYGVWTGSNANSLELVALLDVKETVLLGHTSKICTKTKIFQELTASEYAINRNKEWLETAEKQNIPVYGFKPQKEEIKISGMPPAAEGKTEELIPLLHGGITEGASMLGSSGIHVPGSAGETAGITDGTSGRKRYLVMADGPAGLRLQQSYETDKTTGKIYNTGVLGSLENGFLQEKIHHDNTNGKYNHKVFSPMQSEQIVHLFQIPFRLNRFPILQNINKRHKNHDCQKFKKAPDHNSAREKHQLFFIPPVKNVSQFFEYSHSRITVLFAHRSAYSFIPAHCLSALFVLPYNLFTIFGLHRQNAAKIAMRIPVTYLPRRNPRPCSAAFRNIFRHHGIRPHRHVIRDVDCSNHLRAAPEITVIPDHSRLMAPPCRADGHALLQAAVFSGTHISVHHNRPIVRDRKPRSEHVRRNRKPEPHTQTMKPHFMPFPDQFSHRSTAAVQIILHLPQQNLKLPDFIRKQPGTRILPSS